MRLEASLTWPEAQLGELASKESMLRQSSIIPLLRVTPLLLELSDDVLIGVRVELGMRKKHLKDGTPCAVESTSNPTNEYKSKVSRRGRKQTYPWKVLVASPAKWKRWYFEAGWVTKG